jgi:glycosyltransferase involved in cell wall biosynthesis
MGICKVMYRKTFDLGVRWCEDVPPLCPAFNTVVYYRVMCAPCPKSVILFAYYYLPDNTSGVQRAQRIHKYLPEFGHKSHVICSSHKGADTSLADVDHVPGPQTSNSRTLRLERMAAHIQRRLLPYNEQLPWVPHAVAMARIIAESNPIRAVISTAPPVGTHFAAYRTKCLLGCKWIADFRDPILGNPGRPRKWARPYDAMVQRFIFSNADAVVAVTDAVAEEWRRIYPRWRHKIHVIWNGYDPEDGFGPAPIPPRDHRLCSHVGVLYGLRHPIALLSAMNRLTMKRLIDPDRVKMQFIGPVQDEPALLSHPDARELIERGCLVIRNELVPRSEAMMEIATSDYLLLIDIVNLSGSGYTVPAKLYDYILTGRPILAITQRNSPVDRILAAAGPLHVSLYHEDSEDATATKLLTFFAFPTDSVSPTEWFTTTFNGQRQAEALAALIDQLPVNTQTNSI